MNFQENKPQIDELVSDTQPVLLSNNQTVKQAFDVEHGVMNTKNQGKHYHVTYRQQAVDPVNLSTESTIFTKDRYGVPQLKIRELSNRNSFHTPFPSIRAWVKFEGRVGTPPPDGPCTIIESYNVTSVDQVTLGVGNTIHRITITDPLTFPTNQAFYRADQVPFFDSDIIVPSRGSCITAVAAGQFDIQFIPNIPTWGQFYLWGDA